MPFIEDDLLWCSDSDDKMVDLSQCLDNGGTLGELSDLSNLVPGLDEDTDEEDIFKQLELDNFFDFNSDVKEENNNSVVSSNNKNQVTAYLQELQRNSAANRKFNIAAANPLLAEKLSSPPTSNNNNNNESSTFPTPNRAIKIEPGTRSGNHPLLFKILRIHCLSLL